MICLFAPEFISVTVECEAVPALVRHLQALPPLREGDNASNPHEHKVEKGSASTLGLLAVKVMPHTINIFLIYLFSSQE